MAKKIPTNYAPGNRFTTAYKKDLKIIAHAANYFMLRYNGCNPFVKSVKEFPAFLSYCGAKQIK